MSHQPAETMNAKTRFMTGRQKANRAMLIRMGYSKEDAQAKIDKVTQAAAEKVKLS